MPKYAAFGEIEDLDQIRLALIQGDDIVHTPAVDFPWPFQPIDADLTSWAAVTRASGFDTFAATPTSANLAALVTDESGADKVLFGTPYVAYTPTFTGFGTVSGVAIYSRRIGDCLHIRGRFTSGTSTAVEARMTMGFNGVNGGLTADAAKVISGSTQVAGPGAASTEGATVYRVALIESGVAYLTFGYSVGALGALVKQNGNAYLASGTVFSFTAEIPISGW